MLLDADIREPLFDFLDETYGKNRILEEKIIGASRADVVMIIEGAICGLEIKSDADTYTRLTDQVKDYDKYYDFNIVVVGSSHAGHIAEHVPDYWGIITVDEVDGRPDFYILRKPEKNPNLILERKLKILWRPELVKLQEWHEMPAYKEKSKDFVVSKIVERSEYPKDKKGHIDTYTLHNEISELLFERDYNAIKDIINEYRVANGKRKRRRRYKKRYEKKS